MLRALLHLLLLVTLAACGATHITINPAIRGDPPTMEVRADWNDVDAAAEVAGPQVELAQLSQSLIELPDGRGQHRYTFLATDDTEYELCVTQAQKGAGVTQPGPLILTANGVRRRDANREALLVSAAANRLLDLAGKEWAPLRD